MTTETAPAPVEFLYGIASGQYDGNDDWQAPRVVSFPIIRKTPKRIYYDAREWRTQQVVRFVDRQLIEAEGELWQRSRHWWEPDKHLYLAPPALPDHSQPDVAGLKALMAAAHPDRGGTDAEFIAARERYERAVARA